MALLVDAAGSSYLYMYCMALLVSHAVKIKIKIKKALGKRNVGRI